MVGFLGLVLEEVKSTLGLQGNEKLTLPQVLKAGELQRLCPLILSHVYSHANI